jgi:hypothetical protein
MAWMNVAGICFLWSAIALTLYSGYVYVAAAAKVI